ncbi:MAG TPA: FAD-linked oxidase C-terminal domain-containing protein [Burkholderiaceae bacterium]|nr:FAD-linked oxidase C-terminal domain-containing protein [Burkholderiaceae bacterium]
MQLPAAFTTRLREHFGERFATGAAVCDQHGRDESAYAPMPPDAVVFVESTPEVVALVRACADHRVPLIAFGAGSSLEGQVLAPRGGVCVDLSRMQRILAIDEPDLTASVEAGVTRLQLNAALKGTGLFFAVDPGANATIGGMAATRASGTNALRYGTMRENVLALTVVDARGQVLRTARRAKKSAAGYDLTRLFVGSEGTLGIVTEITVKLAAQPEAIAAAICNFPSVDAAVRTTIATIQMAVPVARCELLDESAVRAVNAYSKLALRDSPLLLFEFHGSESALAEHAAIVQQIAHEHGGVDFVWARTPEERSGLWAARHNAYFAGLRLRPGCRSITTDVCVPISRLAECIEQTRRDVAQAPFPCMLIGHVGDGNFHVQMLIDPNSQVERDEAEACNRRLVQRALDMDGTCSGEHGVGMHKIDFLVAEHGSEGVELMARIKQALDPLGILNPGKMLR